MKTIATALSLVRVLGLSLVALLLTACSGPPSVSEANAAIKQVPQVNALLAMMGRNALDPKVQLVSDLKCQKSGDEQYDCEVLMVKTHWGDQPTARMQFVKFSGQWKAIWRGQ